MPDDGVMTAGGGDWGDGFVPNDSGAEDPEGNTELLRFWSTFVAVVQQPDAAELLPFVAVPSEIPRLVATLPQLRALLADRGLTSRPEWASPDVAYLKLPPSPPEHLRVTKHVPLPAGTIAATLLRCPDLPDQPGQDFGHWRVLAVGDPVPVEEIPGRPKT
jgi:hypothetical protein